MNKFLLVLTLILGMVAFTIAGNIEPGQDQTVKHGYRPGVLVVQYKSSTTTSSKFKISKTTRGIAQVGINSLDQLHKRINVLSVSQDELYQPKDKTLAKKLGVDRIYLVKVAPSSDMEAIAKEYASDPNVESAAPDWEVYPMVVPNDSLYTSQWGHNNTAQMLSYDWDTYSHTGSAVGTVGFDANAEAAWENSQGYGDTSIAIAIVDGGVEWSHPDLSANIWINYGEYGSGKESNSTDDDGNGYTDDYHGWDFGVSDNNPNDDASGSGHGTCCAGIAAAVADNTIGVAGIAGNCKIMALKVANASGTMYFTYINNAIYYAADNGAKVISMSLGSSSYSSTNQTACTYAYNAGAVVLAATGNENSTSISYPAGNSYVVGVGAASNCGDRKRSSSSSSEVNPGVSTDPNGYTCDGERWWGSNYGSSTQDAATAVDVLAPTILPTTDRVGSNGYEDGNYDVYFNGTSCSTPYAAGVCALIFSKYPTLNAQQARDTLCNTAQDIVNVESGSGWDKYAGYGMVDAYAATGGGGEEVTSITVTSPNGGESWAVSSTHNITWTYTGTISNVMIEYTLDGSTYTTITSSTSNTGSYSWTLPSTTTTTAKVRITDVSDATVTDESDASFTITTADVTPPVISSVAASSITSSTAVITWTTDEASTSVVNYGTTTSYGSTTAGSSDVTSHSVTLSGLSSATTYYYEVVSEDAQGNSASDDGHSFTTGGSYSYTPTSTTISSGTRYSGSYSNLASDNGSYYIVKSTTSGTRKCDWYGSTTISQSNSSVSSLTITYNGKNSKSKTQYLYLYNFTTSAWVQIDSRTVSTSDVTITYTQSSPSDYISSSGVIRLRVYTSGGTSIYYSYGDYMLFTVTTSGTSISKSSTSKEIAATPTQFKLHPSFPNPFNPSTTIRYDLAEDAFVTVKVYNVIGQEVALLVNHELQQGGTHDVRLNASSLTSGVYYYRWIVKTGAGKQFSETQKLMLVK